MIRSPHSKEIRKDFNIHSPFPIPNSQFNKQQFIVTTESLHYFKYSMMLWAATLPSPTALAYW